MIQTVMIIGALSLNELLGNTILQSFLPVDPFY